MNKRLSFLIKTAKVTILMLDFFAVWILSVILKDLLFFLLPGIITTPHINLFEQLGIWGGACLARDLFVALQKTEEGEVPEEKVC